MLKFGRRRPSVWKGLVAGMAGGLAGTIAMSQFQNGWQKASQALQAGQNGHKGRSSKADSDKKSEPEKEDATMKAAGKLASLVGYELSLTQKKKASARPWERFMACC
jgi:hypothetical protein